MIIINTRIDNTLKISQDDDITSDILYFELGLTEWNHTRHEVNFALTKKQAQ